MRLSRLFDAWQLYDGLPARHPPGGAARRANSLPANLSYSGRALTDRQRTNEKAPCLRMGLSRLFDAWQFPTLTWGDPTLPSALRRFTSEFGMGSGGTTALLPPGKFCYQHAGSAHQLICITLKILSNPPKHLRRCKVKPHGSLVPVSSTHRCAYTPGLSTSSSLTFLQETLGLRENSSRGKFRA